MKPRIYKDRAAGLNDRPWVVVAGPLSMRFYYWRYAIQWANASVDRRAR